MRRVAPGCQSELAPGGGADSMLVDRQPEVLHPGRNNIAQDTPCFLDIEFRGLWLRIA